MLDIKFVRENVEALKKKISDKGLFVDLDLLIQNDAERRRLQHQADSLKNHHNQVSDLIGQYKFENRDPAALIKDMQELTEKIKVLDLKIRDCSKLIEKILLKIPNIAHESVPVAEAGVRGVEKLTLKAPSIFDFEPKPHWEINEGLELFSVEAGSKVSGSRFIIYKDRGALLHRSIANFLLNYYIEKKGYTELLVPSLATMQSLINAGRDKNFFKCSRKDLYLLPTTLVALLSVNSNQVFKTEELPKKYVTFSSCFDATAAASGQETRGLLRKGQSSRIGVLILSDPQDSYEILEKMVKETLEILKMLELPHRLLLLTAEHLEFAAAKAYSIEVWMPGLNKYREIAQISNYEDFQARRAGIRLREELESSSLQYVHTIGGQSCYVDRLIAAIMENYQQKDGSVVLPEALRNVLNEMKTIYPKN